MDNSTLSLERIIIGILLNDNSKYELIEDQLLPKFFTYPLHMSIFQGILTLINQNIVANPFSLEDYFIQHNIKEDTKYIYQLMEAGYGLTNITHYVKILEDKYTRITLLKHLEEAKISLMEDSLKFDTEEKIEKLERNIYNTVSTKNSNNEIHAYESAQKIIENLEKNMMNRGELIGLDTGFKSINEVTGGFHKGDLVIIAGRPSIGKTAFAMSVGVAMAKKGAGIFLCSLEMPHDQIMMRVLASETNIPLYIIRNNKTPHSKISYIKETHQRLKELLIIIDDNSSMTVSNIRVKARRLKRQHKINVIIVDYIQLIRDTSNDNYDSRATELGFITAGLKAIAKELDIVVIGLSQLSRAVELRDENIPQLSDLKGSGAIEQVADQVMFLYRREYYLRRQKPSEANEAKYSKWQKELAECTNKASLIIAKNRNGPIDTIDLQCDMGITKFFEIETFQEN